MSESGNVNIGGRGRKKLPAVTEEEDTQIREWADEWAVKSKTSSGGCKKLHPVKDDEPLCKVEVATVKRKPIGVYPQGFFPVCKRCAYYWRDR